MPAQVGRVAAEELVSWPIERMDVQQRRILPRDLGIAVHEFEAWIDAFIDPLLKINRGRDRGDRGKDIRVLVRHA